MAEQDSKPTTLESDASPEAVSPKGQPTPSRRLLPLGLGLIALLVGCYWWGTRPADPAPNDLAAPTVAQSSTTSRSPEANAALTRVASSLSPSQATSQVIPTTTPTPVAAASTSVPLPTVTPTVIPSPVATRTIEFSGDATLRMQLNRDNFESSGQPVTVDLMPRTYVLGGDSLTQSEQWCTQLGATGLVFDLTFTLHPITENLHVGGQMQLHDGFCGELGSLGEVLSTAPMDINIPVGTTAILAPTLQAQGSLLGIPNLLNITTGVFLNMNIRNPQPR